MTRLVRSILTIAITLALVGVGAAGAFFSNAAWSSGDTFAEGVIDLMVGNESYLNGVATTSLSWVDTTRSLLGKLFFSFGDLKPEDAGEGTIALTVDTNDAWACLSVSLTANDDTSSNEPELRAGDPPEVPADLWDGELAHNLAFLWWADDGDNVLEDDEYPARVLAGGVRMLDDLATSSGPFVASLADSVTNVWTSVPGPLLAGATYHVGTAWCFGELTPAPLPQDGGDRGRTPVVTGAGVQCEGSTVADPNRVQTDRVALTVAFSARQARHDAAYRCPESYDPPASCTPAQTYADGVVSIEQGLRKNGTAVIPVRSNPLTMLGAPQSTGAPYDDTTNPSILNGFFSLGFSLRGTASVVLSFDDNYVVNGPGNDLKLWEVTGGTSYPNEYVDVYVGNTPTGPWTRVGERVTRDVELDLGTVSAARYVRLVEVSDVTPFEPIADGFDLDALQALNCVVSPQAP